MLIIHAWEAVGFAARKPYRTAALAAFCLLTGCSTSDTVVALNFNLPAPIAGLTTLEVSITQAGQPGVTKSIVPPTVPTDGGAPQAKSAFFERISVPGSWTDAPAQIHVDAKNAQGTTLESADTTTSIRDDGAVAASVTIGKAPVPSMPAASDADAGALAAADSK